MFLNEAYWDISFYRGLCKLIVSNPLIIALIQIDRVLGIVMIIFTLMLPFLWL